MSDRDRAFEAIQTVLCGRFTCRVSAEACADMLAHTIGFMANTPEEAAEVIRQTAEDSIVAVRDNWENLRAARRLLDESPRGSA